MDISKCIETHLDWKHRFHMAIYEREMININDIACDNCCVLGVWLHGEGKTLYSGLESYKTLYTSHALFHLEACRIAEVINTGDFNKALSMLLANSSYAIASSDVILAIVDLVREISPSYAVKNL